MNPPSKILERLIYALVIILSLIAVGLFALAPSLMESKVVYQGF
jgi:hypothetical protein